METWFLNHVLGLSLSVLLLGLPGPLGAGTPSNNSTDSVTAGFHSSTATDELGDMDSNATSTSSSSESLSPSQRNILLTHTAETHTAAAGRSDTEQTETFTETSSRSLEAVSLPTEPLISTTEATTTTSSSSSSGTSGGSSTHSSTSGGSSTSSGTSGTSGSSSSTSGGSSSTTTTSSGTSGTSGTSGGSSTHSSTSGGSSTSSGTSGTSGTSGGSSSTSGGSSSTSGSSSSTTTTSSGTSGTSGTSGGSSSSSSSSSSGSSSTSSSSSSSSGSSSTSSSSSSSKDWKDFVKTDQVSDASPAVSREATSRMLTEKASTPQDSTTFRQGDASSSMSHTAVHTDSTYTSTTITRAGERTLLSVTSSSSNSTSSAVTEDSSSHPSTLGFSAGASETEDYTRSAPSTRTDSGDTTDHHMTHSFSETGSPEASRGTQSLNGQPNATQHHHTSTSEETPDLTPPFGVTEPSTDQFEASVSSTPPVTSPAEGPANVSGTEQESRSSVGTSTESFTGVHSSSTQNQQGTEGVSSQTSEQSSGFGLTTGPPTVSSTPELDDSLTVTPALVYDVPLTTTPVAATERPQITEENTFKATAFTTTNTTTTSPSPATSSPRFSSTISSSAAESPTDATISYTMLSTTTSTLAPHTSATHPNRRESSSQTQGPSTGMDNPTKVPTLQIETSTDTLKVTTVQSQHIPTTYTHRTPTKSTEAPQTIGKQADRGTTELVVTTTPTDVRSTKSPPPLPPPRNPCVSNPCMNGGMCVSGEEHQYTCHCQQAWTGPNCSHDVDECEKDPCPVGSRCVNTRGSFSCECPLGYDLEDGRTCTRAKTFLGTFSVNRLPHDPVVFKSTTMHEIQREIIKLLNASLSVLQGYSRSMLSNKGEDGVRISAVNMFSISTDVTSAEVYNSIQMSLSNCSSSLAHCRMVLHHQLTYHVESLCVAQKTQCDTERSTCTDSSGTAQCQCLQGYYKHNPDDLSCLECGDGYKLENGTCVQCMFGFGGFQCGNFYKLIAVVVSPAGGALLLILIIALIVTCCKKDKNDINKIIFKNGDLQMSPYADFPKNNRISMEWGRETIEMQENGSTKNLLQMTDIYYSPALRNSDLERNGLYPFTGLPGSRHSCIYPAQWNPSFISDDSRRRDYF